MGDRILKPVVVKDLHKSFGDKEVLKGVSFEVEEGEIFGLVGPNGVGKSNLLDAITFALGATSVKSLRAGRLSELIYNGNGNVPPAEYASVTIWLDNSNKIFPYETKEVAIKRKINRKGISIFKINGKTVTREKVLELLSAARIHPDGYNIIKPYMIHVHIKDGKKIAKEKVEFVPVGEGDVDYLSQIIALLKDNYKGYVSLETHWRLKGQLDKELAEKPGGEAFSSMGELSSDICMKNLKKIIEKALEKIK